MTMIPIETIYASVQHDSKASRQPSFALLSAWLRRQNRPASPDAGQDAPQRYAESEMLCPGGSTAAKQKKGTGKCPNSVNCIQASIFPPLI